MRLEVSDNPKRKTKYDLVAVRKQELGWVNMDSQAPNKVVGEWLSKQEFDLVRPEFAFPSCNFMIAASIIQALGKCVKSVLHIAAI